MKRSGTIVTIIAFFIAIAVINFLAARHPFRIDLTKNNIYTLSSATKSILKGLGDVVTIRIYFTENLPPSLQPLRRDVDDVISEFKGTGGRMIQIEYIDPGASAMEEQKAALLGIPPVQLNVIERDKQEVAKIYLGMAILFKDRQQVIPVIRQVQNIEYDISEAIIKVSSEKLPEIAWHSPGESTGETFDYIRENLLRRYNVVDMDSDALSDLDPKKVGTLILISPRKLGENALLAIDRFLMGGGKIVAMMDRFEIDGSLKAIPVESDAFPLMERYGATVDKSLLLDQSNAMAAFSGGPITYHLPYAYWPDIRANQFNHNQPIVSDLESVVLPWTSPLTLMKIIDGAGEEEILAESTAYAVARGGAELELDPQSANEAIISGSRGERTLIALLEGPFGSYFASDDEGGQKRKGLVEESPGSARIFIVGSSRWIGDRFLQNFPMNAALFENAIDAFAMGGELIGIRSREETSRPIAMMPDEVRYFFKFMNIAIGPVMILMIGISVFLVRRRRKRAIRISYS